MNFIFFKDKIETLEYFSARLADALSGLGFETYIHGFYGDRAALFSHIRDGESVLVTFNCIGVSGEPEYISDGVSLWRLHAVTVINILVDHPMYYHEQLEKLAVYASLPERTHIVCIDRNHMRYVRSFYPEAVNLHFMVLAGSGEEYAVDFDKKKYDIIFTGNFTPCSHFERFIECNGPEYAVFYRGIIDDMLSDPSRPVEQVCLEHIKREAPDASPYELRFTMSKFLFIDLYVRFYLREKAIAALDAAGFNLVLIGHGFESLRTKSGRTLSGKALLPTAHCLKETAFAKISLNVMPGFADGGHDRILSSMLCRTLSLTDTSIWLKENFTDGYDLCFYDITRPEGLVDTAAELLANPEKLYAVTLNGNKKALESHTWESRACEILNWIQ
ncbi:MAG: glycosyltransferase family 1 protein [Butyrivibrio sp.]|nr:glycosyltransferase family 1 protein [Butyrivibrio sp.]